MFHCIPQINKTILGINNSRDREIFGGTLTERRSPPTSEMNWKVSEVERSRDSVSCNQSCRNVSFCVNHSNIVEGNRNETVGWGTGDTQFVPQCGMLKFVPVLWHQGNIKTIHTVSYAGILSRTASKRKRVLLTLQVFKWEQKDYEEKPSELEVKYVRASHANEHCVANTKESVHLPVWRRMGAHDFCQQEDGSFSTQKPATVEWFSVLIFHTRGENSAWRGPRVGHIQTVDLHKGEVVFDGYGTFQLQLWIHTCASLTCCLQGSILSGDSDWEWYERDC